MLLFGFIIFIFGHFKNRFICFSAHRTHRFSHTVDWIVLQHTPVKGRQVRVPGLLQSRDGTAASVMYSSLGPLSRSSSAQLSSSCADLLHTKETIKH